MLNSLQMMSHVSPLDLMAAAGHYHAATSAAAAVSSVARIYNSPPPISTSDPLANECKLVDYRGQKVAAFTISGEIMLCLPQAVEMFLKHAVGGPHTVYCKLKRLDIEPLVCNVEQVRILRALGAIQPFVNRCKLLSIKDFDVLFSDCTTKTTSKAGRPAKKILSPGEYSGHSQHKKYQIDNDEYGFDSENMSRRNKLHHFPSSYNAHQLKHMALMQINQHHYPVSSSSLINNSSTSVTNLVPPSHNLPRLDGSTMIKAAVQAGMSPGEIEAFARSGIWGHTAFEDMIKHLESYRLDENGRPLSYEQKLKSSAENLTKLSPILNLSKLNRTDNNNHHPQSDCDESDKSSNDSILQSEQDDTNDNLSDFNISDGEDDNASQSLSLISENTSAKTNLGNNINNNNNNNNFVPLTTKPINLLSSSGSDNIDIQSDQEYHNDNNNLSVETLLWNIQTLLKVATDNARQNEKQTTYEKAELKMDFMRERDVKNSLERQLIEERKLRILYQKRYSRERKLGVRLKNRADSKTKIRICQVD